MEVNSGVLRQRLKTGSLQSVKECIGLDLLADTRIQRKVLNGVTILHLAAELGRLDVVKYLVHDARCPVDVVDCRSGPPLLEAAAAGQIATIEWLRDNGANLHVADERGDSALHVAAGHGQLETVKWLIKQGCKVDAVTKKGITPFLYAAAKGRIMEMKELYRAGGDIGAIDTDLGWSVAHIAAACNHPETLKWVLAQQPSMATLLSKSGETPIDVATQHKSTNAYVVLQRAQKAAKKCSRRQQRLSQRRVQSRLEAEAGRLAAKEADAIFYKVFKEKIERPGSCKARGKPGDARAPSSAKSDSPSRQVVKPQASAVPETDSCSESDEACDANLSRETTGTPTEELISDRLASRSEDERKEESEGEWTIKLSKREKRRKSLKAAHAKLNKAVSTKRDRYSGLNNNCIGGSKNAREGKVSTCSSDAGGVSKSTSLSVPSSKLRPTAAPWSPRRKSWKPGEVKKSEVSARESGKAVQSEFTRMLKKFVHIDAGARRAAKRRFAKASALYEERRVAVADEVESAWRMSLCKRLTAAIANESKVELRSALMEIKSAQEERTLHQSSSQDCSQTKRAQVCDFLSNDAELKRLVDTSRSLLLRLDPPPLHSTVYSAGRSRNEAPSSEETGLDSLTITVNSADDFRNKLQASLATWGLLGLEKVSLKIALEAAQCIPVAASVKFDFESAGPGYCVMTTKY